MSDSPATRRLLALSGVLVGALWLGCSPALAVSQRGHVFSFAFGEEGGHAGQFRHPSAVAVNDSTGEVFVANRGDNKIDEFATVNSGGEPILNSKQQPTVEFIGSFNVPAPEAVAVDNCVQNSKPCTKEQDPSVGDVYVASTTSSEAKEPEPEEGLPVDKFRSDGALIAKITSFELPKQEAETFEGHIDGVAVDSASGDLFVYVEDGKIYKFDNARVNRAASSLESGSGEGKPGFALDSEDNFYVGIETVAHFTDPFDEQLTNLIEEEDEADGLTELGRFALAAKLQAGTGAVTAPELDDELTKAIAVNPINAAENEVSEENDAYLANVTSIAGEPASTIAAFNAEGGLLQRFSAPGLKEADGIAVDSRTGAVYVADAASGDVDVFELEPRGRPVIGQLSACSFGQPGCPNVTSAAQMRAEVDPSGAQTTVEFEYGTASCSAVPAPCQMSPESSIGASFSEQSPSFQVGDLQPGLYHYRVVATNEFGTVRSAEQTFAVLASAGGLPDGREWELVSPAEKDGAEPELTKEGGHIQAALNGQAITYVSDGPVGHRPEGSRNPEYTQLLSTVSSHGEWTTQDITTPNSAGRGIEAGGIQEYVLFSSELSLALVEPFPGGAGTSPLAEPPLSPLLKGEEAGHQEKTVYLRDNAPIAPEEADAEGEQAKLYSKASENGREIGNAGYLPVVTKANAPGHRPFGGDRGEPAGVRALIATPSLTHVLFTAEIAEPGLFEWGPNEQVQRVSVLPGGEATSGFPGDEQALDPRNSISEDGRFVFWTALPHLYARDTVTHETVQLDTPQPGAPPESSSPGPAEAVFQTASTDGSKVFFTDTQRLTVTARARSEEPDLYVAELHGGSSHLSYTLTDLTPEGIHGESADVPAGEEGGGVIGASEDGSYVYFVADAALARDARRGRCAFGAEPAPPGVSCNLYVRRFVDGEWLPAKLIAALSPRDLPDWGGEQEGDLTYMTARVSPKGEYLAFMSERSLTGYDNEDATSKAPGERLDEEVFLYQEVGSGRVLCASCNPSGERPHGVLDPAHNGVFEVRGEGEGLLVDRPRIWSEEFQGNAGADPWLAGSVPGWTPQSVRSALYQPRYLLDDGRLFFDSPDHLVPAATGAKEKVYEYEPGGAGSCGSEGGCVALLSKGAAAAGRVERESAFLDASANGDDIFFLTAEPLVQQDTDDFFDVYDAHVCEPSSPCPAEAAPASSSCDGTAAHPCKHEGAFSAPAFELPAGAGFSGVGNGGGVRVLSIKTSMPPKRPTVAQRLAAALRACRKDASVRKRIACERHARARYAPRRARKARDSKRIERRGK